MIPTSLPFLDPETEPEAHAHSATASLLDELTLYGYRPGQDEPDPRPLPEPEMVRGELAGIVDALAALLADTRLEDDLADLLWSFAALFHRNIDWLERDLDANEQAQNRSRLEQSGSEVRSVELERLIEQGLGLIERRNAFEFFRDTAAERYEVVTGSAWRPRVGSMVNHRALTAAVIDSRDFIAARHRADTQVLLPPGAWIAFTGGAECNDHRRIWDGRARPRPGQASRHGAAARRQSERRRANRRLARADSRKVAQVVFRPDWIRHKNAAPFKRNDQMFEVLPIGLIAFPGSDISDNLVDKARKIGILVWKFGFEGGAYAPLWAGRRGLAMEKSNRKEVGGFQTAEWPYLPFTNPILYARR